MFTLQFLIDMCDHWHFAVEKYVRLRFSFYPLSYSKSRPHKNMFFGSSNTMSSEFWGFLGSPGFQNPPVTWETPAAEWGTRSINHWCHFAGINKQKRTASIYKLLSHRSLVLLYVLRCTEISFSMQVVRLSCKEPCHVLLGGRPSSLRQ